MKGVVEIRESCKESLQRLVRLVEQERLIPSTETRSLVGHLEETLHLALCLSEALMEHEVGRSTNADNADAEAHCGQTQD